jgi:hypothetical protein
VAGMFNIGTHHTDMHEKEGIAASILNLITRWK